MKLVSLRVLAALGIGMVSTTTYSSEYDDAQILPLVESITFGPEQIGIQLARYDYGRQTLPPFVLNRADNTIASVSEDEFASIFGDTISTLPFPYRERETPYLTSDGTPYTRHLCDLYAKVVTSTMMIGGEPFDINFGECVNVSEIEITGDVAWIGAYYPGSHGYSRAHGLIVASIDSAEVIETIDTGPYSAYHIRHDPVADHIWAMSGDRMVVLDLDRNVVARHFFHYDFHPVTGAPEIQITAMETESHPLAVFAMHLPSNQYRSFYESVQSIPDDIARSFSLYDFYMCCHFARPGDPSRRPKEFEILVPFLQFAFEKDLPRWKRHGNAASRRASKMWRQIACNHRDNDEAARLCDVEDWGVLIDAE